MNNINDIDFTLTYEGYLWMSNIQKFFTPSHKSILLCLR